MYNGDEKLINNGEYMPYTMLDFWKWAYSNLLHNMQRGTLAEFIVKSALDQNNVNENFSIKIGLEPYDLDGPWITPWKRAAHIEVKSAAMVQLWDIKQPERANFSIAPAKLPDETGDYREEAPKQRNSDIYVFTLYTATDRHRNILDLSWWEFYVVATDYLDEKFKERKTISLKTLREFCVPCTFDQLYENICSVCSEISTHPDNRNAIFVPPPPEKIRRVKNFHRLIHDGMSLAVLFMENPCITKNAKDFLAFFQFGYHMKLRYSQVFRAAHYILEDFFIYRHSFLLMRQRYSKTQTQSWLLPY